MKLQSKIRSIFSNELLELLASVCDTKRIPSLQDKMRLVGDLMYTNNIKWGLLGGATNRFVAYAGGYAVKFALDSQGYRDNLIEYSICEELQPRVTKSYETNGYSTLAECVRTISESEFIARKQDILNILLELSDDYLLGDVGYLKKNFTNWGVRDNGDLVILDYAYVHRATETLFTCPVCGEGILTYDHVFNNLMCTNKTVCHAKFTYEDIKAIQGDQVDLDMIEERKKLSIVLPGDMSYAEVADPNKKGRFITRDGKKVIIVDNDELYYEMMEAKRTMIIQKFSSDNIMDALVNLAVANTTSDSVAKETAVQNFNDLVCVDDADTVYELDPDYESERIGRMVDGVHTVHGPYDNDSTCQDDADEQVEASLDDLIASVIGTTKSDMVEEYNVPLNDVYEGYNDSSVDLSRVSLSWGSHDDDIAVSDDREVEDVVLITSETTMRLSDITEETITNELPETLSLDDLSRESADDAAQEGIFESDSDDLMLGVVLDGVPI